MKKIFFNTPLFSIFLGVLIPVAVIVQWNKNIESDLAGYKIYWGTHSRAYTNVINAELDTSYTINDLPSGQIYFSLKASMLTSICDHLAVINNVIRKFGYSGADT